MNLLPDDPKLTAYALGELNATERAEIEAALQYSPECRQAVEEIQQMAGLLTTELAAETTPSLTEAQREMVLETSRSGDRRTANGAPASGTASSKIIPFPWTRTILAAAAAVAACFIAVALWRQEKNQADKQLAAATQFESFADEKLLKEAQTQVMVRRTNGASGEVSLNYATSGQLGWKEGENGRSYTSVAAADGLAEKTERFSVALNDPKGADLTHALRADVQIMDIQGGTTSLGLDTVANPAVAKNVVTTGSLSQNGAVNIVRMGGSSGSVGVEYLTAKDGATPSDPAGKVVVGGVFTPANSSAATDPTAVITGKVLAVGDFSFVNGATRNGVVRLRTDGTLDTTFDPGVGYNDTVRALAIQADGSVNASEAEKLKQLTKLSVVPTRQMSMPNVPRPENEALLTGLHNSSGLSTSGVAVGGLPLQNAPALDAMGLPVLVSTTPAPTSQAGTQPSPNGHLSLSKAFLRATNYLEITATNVLATAGTTLIDAPIVNYSRTPVSRIAQLGREIQLQEKEVRELSKKHSEQSQNLTEARKKLADLQAVQLRFAESTRTESERYNSTAAYPRYYETPFVPVLQQALSTFSVDVDTASYANVRRFLNSNQLPPADAVRIEEMVNYFSYNYPQPKGNDPFAVNIESASCPWNADHRLLRVGLKGREMAREKRPASNFVFLIDVSGSMQPAARLPLIKQSLRMLVKKMNAADRVAIVVYASSSGLVLSSTSCEQKEQILAAIDRLEAGGSTNGGEGIQLAYDVASENFIKGGVNRVILCTDGDFNVGITDQTQLTSLIERKAKSGVFLTTLGVGDDNYKDAVMQKLADKGNGNYHYLDSVEEAHKVLVEQMNGTLVTIAKDVKIQIEFNPAQVQSYRLIGYEKRMLRAKDFNDDTKDAGEIGAGHTVTALYEVVPAGSAEIRPASNDLKYQPAPTAERYVKNGNPEMLTLKLRYKQPEGTESKLLEFPYTDENITYRRASTDFKFATAVANFGMILRESQYKAANLDGVLELAEEAKGADVEGYRAEFINLVKKAKALGK